MERFRQWILPVLAAVLILGAAMTVLLLSYPCTPDSLSLARKPFRQSTGAKRESVHSVTYRFLFPDEAHAAPGKLMLGRFADGHLPAAINIDVNAADFSTKVGALDKNVPYAVYCRSGNRSAVAAAALQTLGYTDVSDFGGIIDWPYDDYVVK